MKHVAAAFGAAVLATLAPARAGFVEQPIYVDYHIDTGTETSDFTLHHSVGSGPEFAAFPGDAPTFDVDVADDTIHISNFSEPQTWDNLPFNGLIFSDQENAIPQFASVAVLGTTTMAGLNEGGRVKIVDGDTLSVNWGGLSFTSAPSTIVDLKVTFAATPSTLLPEPTTAGGVAIFAVLLRRRRARSV